MLEQQKTKKKKKKEKRQFPVLSSANVTMGEY